MTVSEPAAPRRSRRWALGLVGLVALIGLAGWGQVALQGHATGQGLVLYLAAVACVIGLGIWCPLRRLATFPPFPPPTPAERPPIQALSFGWECVLVLVLTIAALLSRSWALTELYDFFDLETIDWIDPATHG